MGRAMEVRKEEVRRSIGGTCAVKSQPGKPECPRTAQHKSYICWLATLRTMHIHIRAKFPRNRYKIAEFFVARSARETAGPDRPAARNSGVRPKKCPPENLLVGGPVQLYLWE